MDILVGGIIFFEITSLFVVGVLKRPHVGVPWALSYDVSLKRRNNEREYVLMEPSVFYSGQRVTCGPWRHTMYNGWNNTFH